MPACLRHSGPHACPHLHTVACPILCCQTRRSRVTCVFVKVRVCVSLAERDVKCDRNASEVAKHDCDKSGFFLGGEGKTRTAPPLYQHSFPAFPPPSIPWDATPPVDQQMAASPHQNHSSALISSGWVVFTVKTLP